MLDETGIDLVLAVTKHNVQYLLGGYRYFFFEHADAIGTGRYLPVVGYFRVDLNWRSMSEQAMKPGVWKFFLSGRPIL